MATVTHHVTFWMEPGVQIVPVPGEMTGGSKTSAGAAKTAETAAKVAKKIAREENIVVLDESKSKTAEQLGCIPTCFYTSSCI